MESIIEMAVALNRYSAGELAPNDAASILTANMASLNSVETSNLRKSAQSVAFSLADIEWTGAHLEITEKLRDLQFQLNKLVSASTSIVDAPEYLSDEFHPEQLLGIDIGDTRSFELRKEGSTGVIFLCSKDLKKNLMGARKFKDFGEFEEAIWAT